jgi:hypothetical protein
MLGLRLDRRILALADWQIWDRHPRGKAKAIAIVASARVIRAIMDIRIQGSWGDLWDWE